MIFIATSQETTRREERENSCTLLPSLASSGLLNSTEARGRRMRAILALVLSMLPVLRWSQAFQLRRGGAGRGGGLGRVGVCERRAGSVAVCTSPVRTFAHFSTRSDLSDSSGGNCTDDGGTKGASTGSSGLSGTKVLERSGGVSAVAERPAAAAEAAALRVHTAFMDAHAMEMKRARLAARERVGESMAAPETSLPSRAPLDFAGTSTIETAERWARELSGTSAAAPSEDVRGAGTPESESKLLLELRQRLQEAPESAGIYMFRDSTGRLLYIGKSVNLKQRLRSYFRGLPTIDELTSYSNNNAAAGGATTSEFGHPKIPGVAAGGFSPASSLGRRQATMVRLIRSLDTIVTEDAEEALALESALIRQRQPPFNVLLKDDKGVYPYLCITWSQPYPDIFITRYKKKQKRSPPSSSSSSSPSSSSPLPPALAAFPEHEGEDVYLGPFVDSRQLRATLELVKETFLLRQRFRPVHAHKPCLNYDIGRCPGVCQGLVAPQEYRSTVRQAQMVFQGKRGRSKPVGLFERA